MVLSSYPNFKTSEVWGFSSRLITGTRKKTPNKNHPPEKIAGTVIVSADSHRHTLLPKVDKVF